MHRSFHFHVSMSITQGRPTSAFLFRVGGRRKTSPALVTATTPTTTTTLKPSSRPTKLTRRKYPFQTARPLESQVSSQTPAGLPETTPKPTKPADSRFKFASRKPFFKTTTDRTRAHDQDKESSNQQSLEQDFDSDITELGDIALALQEIQQAPVPSKITVTTRAPIQRVRSTRPLRPKITSTTSSPSISTTRRLVSRIRPQAFEKITSAITNTYRPLSEYDYYDDSQMSILDSIPEHSKVLLHSNGVIECLDQGNFPHPVSCKKFISCAKMENGKVLGWEYTCPKNLSFDPIGGICNWSAGLGCQET